MNRMMILAAFLTSSLCAPVIALNEEQREILYILNDLGQSFDSVPVEDVGMFIGMLKLNMRITKAQIKRATSQRKKALLSGAALVVAVVLFRNYVPSLPSSTLRKMMQEKFISYDTYKSINYYAEMLCGNLSNNLTFGAMVAADVYSGMSIYDAFKAKNELEASLARDKEILRKLEELRNSLPAEQQNFDVNGMMEGAK